MYPAHRSVCRLQDLQRHKQQLPIRGIDEHWEYFYTLLLTKEDVKEFMKCKSEYKKANAYKPIKIKLYI